MRDAGASHHRAVASDTGEFDYVIIGAGAAGCVLADRLSRERRHSVLVLEAGGSDWSPFHHVPAGKLMTLANPSFDWKFRTAPDPSRLGREEIWPRGKVLGGSTTINGMFYVRGNPDDFDGWARLGAAGWSYADVLPWFRSIETYAGGDPEYRGRTGPLLVSDVPGPHPFSRTFVQAAADTGIAPNPDYNGRTHEGASLAQTTIHGGFRQSAAKAFLHPARREGRVHVVTGAMVERIEFSGDEASGVAYRRDGEACRVRARREVLLCAGSIGSPCILMRSGVGPAAHLRECGIDVRVDLEGVGGNLQEHAGVWIVQGVRPGHRTANMDYNPWGMVRQTARYLATRQGPVGTPTAQALAFFRTDPAEPVPDIQLHFMPMGYRFADSAIEVLDTPAIMAVPNVNRPESRGEVRLAPADPLGPPLIFPRLLESADDVRRMIAACRHVRRIFAAPAFADIVDGELFPGPAVQTDAQWEDVLRRRVSPIFHVVGTCRMGADAGAVVDPELRVRGVRRLRVVDSAVMPTLTSGNTNAPTLMIAARAADLILESSND